MKKFLVWLAMFPVLAFAVEAFTPNKHSCQAVMKDVVMVMSYVVPCGEDTQNPAILVQHAKAKSVIDARLQACDEVFSSEQEEAMMDELRSALEPDIQAWKYQAMTDKSTFCQSQKNVITQRLLEYIK